MCVCVWVGGCVGGCGWVGGCVGVGGYVCVCVGVGMGVRCVCGGVCFNSFETTGRTRMKL